MGVSVSTPVLLLDVDGVLNANIDLQALHARRLVLFGVDGVHP